MAVKNVYKDFIKYLLKSDRVRLQRVKDTVYITDGYAELKVPFKEYTLNIRPLDYGTFIDLEDGDEAIRDLGESLSVKRDMGGRLEYLYDSTKADKPAVLTDFYMKVRKRDGDIRFLIADGLYVGVNDKYISGAKQFIPSFSVGGNRLRSIKGELGDIGVIICPIRYNEEPLNFFKTGGKNNE